MKLAIYFGINAVPYIVEWDKDILDFHHYLHLDDEDWQWQIHDKDPTFLGDKPIDGVSHYLLFTTTTAVPYDMFGMKLPIADFRNIFKIVEKKCECGAKYTGFSSIHMFYCPMWSEE